MECRCVRRCIPLRRELRRILPGRFLAAQRNRTRPRVPRAIHMAAAVCNSCSRFCG
jgi:hypothetical protein